MPEIPELESIRGFFNEQIIGVPIVSLEARIPHIFRTSAQELRDTLPGDAFGTVSRHGKFLLFPLHPIQSLRELFQSEPAKPPTPPPEKSP